RTGWCSGVGAGLVTRSSLVASSRAAHLGNPSLRWAPRGQDRAGQGTTAVTPAVVPRGCPGVAPGLRRGCTVVPCGCAVGAPGRSVPLGGLGVFAQFAVDLAVDLALHEEREQRHNAAQGDGDEAAERPAHLG